MTLYDLVEEVDERTHLGKLEILELVRENWPHKEVFSRTEALLMSSLAEKKAKECLASL